MALQITTHSNWAFISGGSTGQKHQTKQQWKAAVGLGPFTVRCRHSAEAPEWSVYFCWADQKLRWGAAAWFLLYQHWYLRAPPWQAELNAKNGCFFLIWMGHVLAAEQPGIGRSVPSWRRRPTKRPRIFSDRGSWESQWQGPGRVRAVGSSGWAQNSTIDVDLCGFLTRDDENVDKSDRSVPPVFKICHLFWAGLKVAYLYTSIFQDGNWQFLKPIPSWAPISRSRLLLDPKKHVFRSEHHAKVYVKLFANLDDEFKYALLNQVQIQFFKAGWWVNDGESFLVEKKCQIVAGRGFDLQRERCGGFLQLSRVFGA